MEKTKVGNTALELAGLSSRVRTEYQEEVKTVRSIDELLAAVGIGPGRVITGAAVPRSFETQLLKYGAPAPRSRCRSLS